MSDSSLETLQLETARLILRVPRLADLDSFAALMADEENARFIGGVAPREVTWRALMTMIGAWHATGVSMFSVFEKVTGRWVGRLGPWQPEGWPGAGPHHRARRPGADRGEDRAPGLRQRGARRHPGEGDQA